MMFQEFLPMFIGAVVSLLVIIMIGAVIDRLSRKNGNPPSKLKFEILARSKQARS